MIRGTRILVGDEARRHTDAIGVLRDELYRAGYLEVILPNLWEQQTFVGKAGPEILGQLYAFKDKGDRDICLAPEATAIVQEQYNESWSKSWTKPCRVFYVQRCYRYEKPQKGRYREFTQVGVELLGNKPGDREEVVELLKKCLSLFPVVYGFKDAVKRGLTYYVEDGFEVEVASLGAQKQIAGGGRYKEGIGWGIGLDRRLVATEGNVASEGQRCGGTTDAE